MTWRHDGVGGTAIAGYGAMDAVPGEFAKRGFSRVFVVSSPSASTGRGMRLLDAALAGVEIVGTFTSVRQHAPEADVTGIATGIRQSRPDVVVAVGGASPGDAAKGGALLVAGKPLELDLSLLSAGPAGYPGLLPVVTVPTTLASADFTPGGAFTRDGHKSFFVAPGLAARLAIYDPRCLEDTPADVLCASGMNGLAHCLESAYSHAATPFSRALGTAATAAFTRWLPPRASGDASAEVLSGLADAAVLSGLTFASGGSGVHHAICHVLGGLLRIPHASANAAVLPYALAANESHSRGIQADLAAVMAVELEHHQVPSGPALADQVQALQHLIRQPATLQDLGVPENMLDVVAAEVLEREPGLGGNPRPVDRDLLLQILTAAWHGDLVLAAK